MKIPGFTAAAALSRPNGQYHSGFTPAPRDRSAPVTPALVGRWRVPWTNCEVNCIEVCTRFCHPTGWDCCQWETRCALSCSGEVILTNY
jgi:hypothetical protein